MPNLTENTQKAPYLHEKHKNTRKKGRKYTFFQIDKILKIVPRLDGYIWFPFFPGSRTDFKLPYGHILFWSKGDQNYYIFTAIFIVLKSQIYPFFSDYWKLLKLSPSTEITEIEISFLAEYFGKNIECVDGPPWRVT